MNKLHWLVYFHFYWPIARQIHLNLAITSVKKKILNAPRSFHRIVKGESYAIGSNFKLICGSFRWLLENCGNFHLISVEKSSEFFYWPTLSIRGPCLMLLLLKYSVKNIERRMFRKVTKHIISFSVRLSLNYWVKENVKKYFEFICEQNKWRIEV